MGMFLVIAAMLVFTVTGLLLRTRGLVKSSAAHRLNRLALDVTLPAGIFRSLHNFPIHRDALALPLVTLAVSLVMWGVAAGAARALRLSPRDAAVLVLSVVLSNSAFMGYPFVSATYGDEGLRQAVLVDQLGMEPLAFTWGTAIAVNAAGGAGFSWVQELTKLLRFPPLLALAAAVIWRLAGLPAVPHGIDLLLRGISLVTVPLVMISLGLVLHAGAIRRAWRTAGLVSLFRLVMAPTLGWVLSQRVGLTGLQATVTTVELGMPAMMFSLMLAIQNGLDAELSAAFVTATLVGSVVSLPVWVFLLR